MRRGPVVASFGYHEVTDEPGASGFQRSSAQPYKLTRVAFAHHLDQVAGGGLVPELVLDIEPARPGRHLLLTFDDGGKSALYISEALCRRGWRGHFFIVTGLIGSRTFLDAAEIRHVRSCGHVIGTHSHTHPGAFREQPFGQMFEEWRVSRDRLCQLLGEPCTTGSVPGGDISRPAFASAASAGLRYLFTSDPTLRPERVNDCWVLGRFIPKATTSPARVGQLARFRGWRRALLARRMKLLLRGMAPGDYRTYVRLRAGAPIQGDGSPAAPGRSEV